MLSNTFQTNRNLAKSATDYLFTCLVLQKQTIHLQNRLKLFITSPTENCLGKGAPHKKFNHRQGKNGQKNLENYYAVRQV